MKRPVISFVLSAVLPGAGLWYVGKRGWGLLNFLVVLVVGLVLPYVLLRDVIADSIHYFWIACAAGSGGLAHAVAFQVNEKEETCETETPPEP